MSYIKLFPHSKMQKYNNIYNKIIIYINSFPGITPWYMVSHLLHSNIFIFVSRKDYEYKKIFLDGGVIHAQFKNPIEFNILFGRLFVSLHMIVFVQFDTL